MKKILSLMLAALLLLSLCGCKNTDKWFLDRPSDTDLSLWITEEVSEAVFSEYTATAYSVLGGNAVYEKGYTSVLTSSGERADPEHFVKYRVDQHTNGKRYVTLVSVTDPDVRVYGLTVESTLAEFDATMEAAGFTVTAMDENLHIAKRYNVEIEFDRRGLLVLHAVMLFD